MSKELFFIKLDKANPVPILNIKHSKDFKTDYKNRMTIALRLAHVIITVTWDEIFKFIFHALSFLNDEESVTGYIIMCTCIWSSFNPKILFVLIVNPRKLLLFLCN